MNTHSNQNKTKLVLLFLAAVLLTGCGEEEPKRDFIARVENSYLTNEDLASELDTTYLESSHKNEYIRNWIDNEVLYQEAINEDITDESDYQRIIDKSKKELANAFLTKKIFQENELEYNQQDLIDFYQARKSEFKVFRNSYLYNLITFDDEDKAILFRSTLIESDWNKASKGFRDDPSILQEKINIFCSDYKVQPFTLQKIISELLPGEVSIILNLEPYRYLVVQLIRKYSQGEVPEFEEIKSSVEERYINVKRKIFMKEYMNELYSKYKIVINKRK